MHEFQPGMIIQARGRLWRVDHADSMTVTGSSLDNPNTASRTFFIPLEQEGCPRCKRWLFSDSMIAEHVHDEGGKKKCPQA